MASSHRRVPRRSAFSRLEPVTTGVDASRAAS
jgi:hypothetical protein